MKMIKPNLLIGRETMITWNSLIMSEMLLKWVNWKQNILLFIIEWEIYQLKFQFTRHYLIIVCLNSKEYSCKEICKKNKKSAVDYFTISARENESLAIEKLLSLGEAPPPINSISRSPSVYATPLPVPPPMPVIIQPQPPRIIILPQVQIQPKMNLNGCIQDGGPIFCPNHSNTRR